MKESNNPVISVIIPCYNVEDYISECLNTVINQTFKELEIIVIDDGSKDCTKDIIEKFAKKDKRIIVINQENSGPSAARNRGVEIARGQYIGFIDSDDYIDNKREIENGKQRTIN